MDHTWASTNVYDDLPPFAIQAGHDSDGDPIYVGRAYHNGHILLAKVIPKKKKVCVAWGGKEIDKHDVEILTGHYYVWIPSSAGSVPPHALQVGQTSDGKPLYVGRGHWASSLIPGKIRPSHGCLYIHHGGVEHKLESYEVLVKPDTWVSSSLYNIVPDAIIAGRDCDGADIYAARVYHNGNLLPAKVVRNKGCASVAYGGKEHTKYDFEMLVARNYSYGWIHGSNGSIPPGAVVCGCTSEGEKLYLGRGQYRGSLTPGTIHPSHSCLYIAFDGQEIRIYDYEVLIRMVSTNFK